MLYGLGKCIILTHMAKPNLKQIRILIADNDNNLGMMLTQVLQRMGFGNIQVVKDGEAAMRVLRQEPKDILITEWHLQSVDGIALTNHIRHSEESTDRLLPIIMMTARAERQDVEEARDAGITEFVVKPYSSVTVFKRIQQVIDNPRPFLLAQYYVGPDRRRRELEFDGDNRRTSFPRVVPPEEAQNRVSELTRLVLPEFILKKRLGLHDPLDSIITPQVLAQAQGVIDNLKDEALVWIKDYLAAVDAGYKKVVVQPSQIVLDSILEALLAIKANAGTFGYVTASQLGHQLYQFMRFDYAMGNSRHNHVLLKHLQALTVLLGSKVEGRTMEKEGWLLNGLKIMIAKFQKG